MTHAEEDGEDHFAV